MKPTDQYFSWTQMQNPQQNISHQILSSELNSQIQLITWHWMSNSSIKLNTFRINVMIILPHSSTRHSALVFLHLCKWYQQPPRFSTKKPRSHLSFFPFPNPPNPIKLARDLSTVISKIYPKSTTFHHFALPNITVVSNYQSYFIINFLNECNFP